MRFAFHINSAKYSLALSVRWWESKNKCSLTLSHNSYSFIPLFPPQLSTPLYGPLPQHPTLATLKPSIPKTSNRKQWIQCAKSKLDLSMFLIFIIYLFYAFSSYNFFNDFGPINFCFAVWVPNDIFSVLIKLQIFYIGLLEYIHFSPCYLKNVKNLFSQRFGHAIAEEILSKSVYLFNIGANDYGSLLDPNSTSVLLPVDHQGFVDIVIGNLTDAIKVSTNFELIVEK